MNPFTQLELSQKHMKQFQYRVQKLKALNISLLMDGEEPIKKKRKLCEKDVQQFLILIVHQLNILGYQITVDMIHGLTLQQMLDWYMQCEDIWNYRAELSPQARVNIYPDGNLFA